MPIVSALARNGHLILPFAPTCEGIFSWNAAECTNIDVRMLYYDGSYSAWLPYVRCEPWRSCSIQHDDVQISVDMLRSRKPMIALEVQASSAAIFFLASPFLAGVSSIVRTLTQLPLAMALPVPRYSQYVAEQRGWCNPASLAMVLGFWAKREKQLQWDLTVEEVAAEIHDHDYGGTGNWTFATAYAARLGLRAFVCYFRDLHDIQAFLLIGVPVVIAIAWEEGELPGASLPRSDGHLVVICGFDDRGAVRVHDPALLEVETLYPRAELETVWRSAGGVGYIVVPLRCEREVFAILAGFQATSV